MTRQEFTNQRDLTFSNWVRKMLPDSSLGYMVSDLDFIIQNYKTKKLVLLEIKTRNAKVRPWQYKLFLNLEKWIRRGIDEDWTFLGYNIIVFENTFFTDGKVFLNNKLSSENEIIKLLSF